MKSYPIEVLELYYSSGIERHQCALEFDMMTNGSLSWEEYWNIPDSLFQELLSNKTLEEEVMKHTINNEETPVLSKDIADVMYGNIPLPF